jgi:hypothetical protein
LALYLGNKTEKNVQFSLSVDDVPEVKTQLAPLPQDIGSKMQAQCQMQCACYGVFVNTPKLVVAFDGRDIPPIELPIHAAKFYSVAQQTQPQDFFAKWRRSFERVQRLAKRQVDDTRELRSQSRQRRFWRSVLQRAERRVAVIAPFRI